MLEQSMAIPRRLVMIAIGAAGAGVALYLRNKAAERREQERRDQERKDPVPAPSTDAQQKPADPAQPPPGAVQELARFLAGESWYDEMGWHGIWDREGIDAPEGWLKTKGKDVLAAERKKLVDHPALLAGCRRRWIVVCRYAGIDVTDAAQLWNVVDA
jgi:hypothetical protein